MMKNTRHLKALALLLALLCTSSQVFAQTLGDAPDLSRLAGVVRLSGVLMSVVVIATSVVVLRFATSVAEKLSAQFANRRLTIQKVESFGRFILYFVTATMCIVLSFRIDKEVLTLMGGGMAVAVGFAMRDLVAAIIAGITIMFDRPFQVGDRVKYAGEYGDIEQIGLRSVRMRTLDDSVVTIPNNKVLTDVTSSCNYGALDMQLVMDFYVGIDQDAELAERLVKESMLTSRYVFLEKPVVVLVKQVIEREYVAIKVRGKAYVHDTKYESLFEADVTKRVLRAFRKHQVAPPAMLHRVDARDVANLLDATRT